MFREAEDYIFSEDYTEALYLLNQLKKNGYDNAHIEYLTGFCYLHIPGQKALALPLLQKASENMASDASDTDYNEQRAPLKTLFYLAQAYLVSGDPYNAEKILQHILQSATLDKKTLQLVNKELDYCKNAREFFSIPVKYKSTMPGEGVNTSRDEYNPCITPDEKEMVFMVSKKFYNGIYSSYNDPAGWLPREELTGDVGSDGECAVVSISPDGNKIFLTAYAMYTNDDLFESDFNGQRWLKKVRLPEPVNSAYSEKYASLAPDGKTLYFSSNRPGGYGGQDIYRSTLEPDGHWTKPENLGPVINTPEDELAPFVSADGKYLWFSSEGHNSMGGLDIFRAAITNEGFRAPLNIGWPVNTTDDDIFFCPVDAPSTGFTATFDSTSPGTRNIRRIEIESFPDPARFILSGKVILSDSAQTEQPVTISIVNSDRHDTALLYASPAQPTFTIHLKSGQYLCSAWSADYDTLREGLSITLDQPESDIVHNFKLERTLSSLSSINKTQIIIRPVYFLFDQWTLSVKDRQYLDSLVSVLKILPEVKIYLIGYTDAQGSETYNKMLSLHRAKAVFEILKKGIDPSKIWVEGQGEKDPVSSDICPESRKWNRRVTIILENTGNCVPVYSEPAIPAKYKLQVR